MPPPPSPSGRNRSPPVMRVTSSNDTPRPFFGSTSPPGSVNPPRRSGAAARGWPTLHRIAGDLSSHRVQTVVQISLDLTNTTEALETATMARRAGVDWLEAGTP